MAISYKATAYLDTGLKPTSIIALGYQLEGPYEITIKDDTSPGPTGRTTDINPSGVAKWYRTFLAPGSGNDGTEEKPYELLTHITGQIGGYFAWTLTDTGYVKVTYSNAATVQGAIEWSGTGSEVIAHLLGFSSDSGAPINLTDLTPGESSVAPYQPTAMLYLVAREQATGWRTRSTLASASVSAAGRVRGRVGSNRLHTQQFTARAHPRSIDEKHEHGSHATPMFAPDQLIERAHNPSGPIGVAAPTSLDEFLSACVGRRLAFALGNAQEHFADTADEYEVGYVHPDTIRAQEAQAKSDGAWKAFYDFPGFKLTRVIGSGTDGTETR